ncbi:hypothetical protein MVES1_002721 [Malassezia vespertilionis]|uniref:uncharacterized protein n=1 Tax=Malassezia vespertilionis TaxID=2020962 RepID=UPI0024B1E4A2|nr:uncharacterized protein MVES1_002721 [Malassezia vespertilionis]WFD07358.1 hypothetical protein MVES1_002721 [Malassezia vespertilionis]
MASQAVRTPLPKVVLTRIPPRALQPPHAAANMNRAPTARYQGPLFSLRLYPLEGIDVGARQQTMPKVYGPPWLPWPPDPATSPLRQKRRMRMYIPASNTYHLRTTVFVSKKRVHKLAVVRNRCRTQLTSSLKRLVQQEHTPLRTLYAYIFFAFAPLYAAPHRLSFACTLVPMSQTQPSSSAKPPGGPEKEAHSGGQKEGLPQPAIAASAKPKVHPAVIISIWIALSSSVIVYNKYVLDNLKYPYPVFLTTFHMAFAAIGTRVLARYTTLLKGLSNVEMNMERWTRNILPIGALFSGSLVFSNMAYLSLNVSFIQMLKAFTPVAVLLISFAFGLKKLSGTLTMIVAMISVGVCLASYGEVDFDITGFVYQVLAIAFESTRLVMVQVLLQGLKMDPLVSLYYFSPVCAALNMCLLPFTEGLAPFRSLAQLGPVVLLSNAGVAFGLNIASVFLIGAASSLTLTLAGVLKDILLILGSMWILGSRVTGLQFIGYAIALGGLVLFKTHKG